MDLLNNKKYGASDLQQKILTKLSFVGISVENMEIAEEFFDFSKERDLSLLDKIKRQYLFKDDNERDIDLRTLIYELLYRRGEDCSVRWTLFFDALGGSTIARYLVLDPENVHFKLLFNIFKVKYSEELSAAKVLALMPDSDSRALFIEKPEILYMAGSECCTEDESYARASLYAYIIGYCKDSEKITNEQIKLMCDYIVSRLGIIEYAEEKERIYDYIIPRVGIKEYEGKKEKDLFKKAKIAFESLCGDKRIYKLMKNYVKQDIRVIIESVYGEGDICIKNNIDKLLSIVDNDKFLDFANKEFKRKERITLIMYSICKCYIEYYPLNKDRIGNGNINAYYYILKYMAQKYPTEFACVMFSGEKLPYNFGGVGYICFYTKMLDILEKNNPKYIKEGNIDFEKKFIDAVINCEKRIANQISDEIEKYLSGQADISVLQNVIDEVDYGFYYRYNKMMIEAVEIYPKFYDKYVSFKTIVCPDHVAGSVQSDNAYSLVKKIISALIRENVTMQHRIKLYEYINEVTYNERVSRLAEEAIRDSMVERREELDSEYEMFFGNGSVYLRKIYAEYLDITNGEDNKNKDRLLAMCSDTSKEVKAVVINLILKHKEYEEDIFGLISSKKQAVRDTAIDILSGWGANNYRDIFEKALKTEKSAKIADKLSKLLNIAVSGKSEETENLPEQIVEKLHKGGKNRKVLWLYEKANPVVHFKNGEAADDKYMQAIILCYANMQTLGRNDVAIMLADKLKEDELSKFSMEIFSKWLDDGAESKKKWALYFSVIHGGDVMVETALSYIKEWAENMRGAIAAEAVKAIALNGSPLALMTVDNLAHKFKQKQVKKAAAEAMDTAAEALGITADELGDKIVPDLGFDENMQRIFDYGTRKFKVYLTPALELEVYDETDKKLKTMPSPGKKDDEETAKASNAEFKQMKKQLKNVISIQKIRLETALLADRRWSRDNWEKLFVKNPVMHSFAIGLIWAAYDGDNMVQTFRYMEDGSFNTVDEEEYELTDNVKIGLVHPIDLDDDTLSAWKEQLSDYEVSQPIEQLERRVYRINNGEIGKLDLKRFNGRVLNGMSLLGRTSKFGWSKGSVQDGGGFYVFYREDVTEKIKNPDGTVSLKGNAVELHFSGMYVGGEDENVTIENVRFYIPGTIRHGSYVYDEADNKKAIMLDKVNPRYFSEILNQLEEITKQAESSAKA